jgi:hypothetical protein
MAHEFSKEEIAQIARDMQKGTDWILTGNWPDEGDLSGDRAPLPSPLSPRIGAMALELPQD